METLEDFGEDADNRCVTTVLAAAKRLSREVDRLDFAPDVEWVYNPLHYAWPSHGEYLSRYLNSGCEVLFLGMNPGPWGMAQTGIPFGEVNAVRDWLRIDAPIARPKREHPKRPVQGMDCPRSEISGKRFWGLFKERFKTPEKFFKRHFVTNYCPLVFMESTARNLTPDKLPVELKQPLEVVCDRFLSQMITAVRPRWLVGVGSWAERCAQRVVRDQGYTDIRIGRLLHPSPASPAANRNWAEAATQQMKALGIWD
jgi:single-strand selective monofunctional uracil DNA glycosylase